MSKQPNTNFLKVGNTIECAHCKGDKYLDAEKKYGIKCDCKCHMSKENNWEEEIREALIDTLKYQEFSESVERIHKLLTQAIKEEKDRIAKGIKGLNIYGSTPMKCNCDGAITGKECIAHEDGYNQALSDALSIINKE